MENVIYVNYLSRFANNIFQHSLAHIIKDLTGGTICFSPTCVIRSGERHDRPAEEVPIEEIPLYGITNSRNILVRKEWSGKFHDDERTALRKTGVSFAKDILRFEQDRLVISDSYRGGPVIISGYYQDYRYYKGRRSLVSSLLDLKPPLRSPGKRDVVLHFRGTDLSSAQMPLGYYCWILANERFERLWIVTDDPGHEAVLKLADLYPSTVVSDGVISDFPFIMAAKTIILTVSTFSWMAAWLSNADKIYFPLGSSLPLFDKDGDRRLIVTDDPRYIYVKPYFRRSFLRKVFPWYRLVA